jgi:hypothetical protein
VRLVGDVEQEAEHDADRDDARERERRVADPARIEARELDLGRSAAPRRAPDGRVAAAAAPAPAVQQLRAQRGGLGAVRPSSRTPPRPRESERPVPISTRASPSSRCIARAVTSTVRMRSRETARTRRRKRPEATSTRSSVTR